MAPKVKAAVGEAASWLSEALETAAGWALIVVAAYGLLFVDLTGNGRLWDALRGAIQENAQLPPPAKNMAVEMHVVPVRPPDEAVKAQNHMLLVPEEPEKEISVPVAAAVQPARPEALTDAPADARASGKDWKKHLTSRLRTFTVYGEGEEHSSASASNGASAASRSVAASPVPTPATADSAYKAGAAASARPGISSRVTPVSNGAADSVRNFH